MVREKCVLCRIFIRGKGNKVGQKYFWKDFVAFVAKKGTGTPYQRKDFVCGKCHIQIRRASGKLKGRPVVTAAVGTQGQSTNLGSGHTGSEGLPHGGGAAGTEGLHESVDGSEGLLGNVGIPAIGGKDPIANCFIQTNPASAGKL